MEIRVYGSEVSDRDLAGFSGVGYEKGAGKVKQALWMAASTGVTTRWWCPNRLRLAVLRQFGAHIGDGVIIRHGVRIHWPWKLRVGDNSWIGEQVWILNLEDVHIGNDVCISQSSLLCTGSHRFDSPTFEFDNAPIIIGNGVWIAAQSTVLRGVEIGHNALIGARCLVVKNVPPRSRVMAMQDRVQS